MEQAYTPKNATVEYNEMKASGASLIQSFDELAKNGAADSQKQAAMDNALAQYQKTLKEVVVTPEGAHLKTIKTCVADTLDELLQRSDSIQTERMKTKDEKSYENLWKLDQKAISACKKIVDCLIISAHDGGYPLEQTANGIAILPKDMKPGMPNYQIEK